MNLTVKQRTKVTITLKKATSARPKLTSQLQPATLSTYRQKYTLNVPLTSIHARKPKNHTLQQTQISFYGINVKGGDTNSEHRSSHEKTKDNWTKDLQSTRTETVPGVRGYCETPSQQNWQNTRQSDPTTQDQISPFYAQEMPGVWTMALSKAEQSPGRQTA